MSKMCGDKVSNASNKEGFGLPLASHLLWQNAKMTMLMPVGDMNT